MSNWEQLGRTTAKTAGTVVIITDDRRSAHQVDPLGRAFVELGPSRWSRELAAVLSAPPAFVELPAL